MQQAVQLRVSGNGFSRRRVERESGIQVDNKSQLGKSNLTNFTTEGLMHGGKFGGHESPSRDRLIFLVSCLIGHQVEVHVKNGSIFSGIFHASDTEKDFGIILKMARLIKDGSFRGQNSVPDSISKPPSKTIIIPATELVQVLAKDVSVIRNDVAIGPQRERHQDIMIDSSISKFHFVEAERQLERWIPENIDSQCPEFENIFDATQNRKWDQFETNAALFGVKSTFDEELYTTKLVKGPQMRELEREALRIAREIEGEDTRDLHLAEERGLHFHDDFNIDEETRYSSVFRGCDDSGFEEEDEVVLDLHNTETFGDFSSSLISKPSDMSRGKNNDRAIASSTCLSVDEKDPSQLNTGRGFPWSSSNDHARQLDKEERLNDNQSEKQHQEANCAEGFTEKKTLEEEAQTLKSEVMQSSQDVKKTTPDIEGLSFNPMACAPSSSVSSKGQESVGFLGEFSTSKETGKPHVSYPWKKPGSSTSSTSDRATAASTSSSPGLSPSSSLGSVSSDKSKLNPYAKEFKLNPNAKSFAPSQAPLRPPSPVSDTSYYFPANTLAVPHMHGLPVGIGIGPSYTGPQPVMYGSQGVPIQPPQAFVHPNGPPPMYGQQMILSNPRQVLYMPTYPHEMTFK